MQSEGVDAYRYHNSADRTADHEQTDIAGPTRCDLNLLALQHANAFQQYERNGNAEENELIQDLEFFSHRRQLSLRRSIVPIAGLWLDQRETPGGRGLSATGPRIRPSDGPEMRT